MLVEWVALITLIVPDGISQKHERTPVTFATRAECNEQVLKLHLERLNLSQGDMRWTCYARPAPPLVAKGPP